MRTSRVLVATLILLVGTTLVVTIVALFQPGSATHEAMPLWWFPTFTSAGLLVSVVPGVAMALALLTSKRDWAHANEYRVVLPTVAVGSLFWFIAPLPNWHLGLLGAAMLLAAWIVWELRGLSRDNCRAIRAALRGRPNTLWGSRDEDLEFHSVSHSELLDPALPKSPFGKQGYRYDDVDVFLRLIADELQGSDLSESDIHSITFRCAAPLTRGYDTESVDRFLDRIAETIARGHGGEGQ
ncbi:MULTISPECIES: DivIVA domain-containing protein [Mycobacterium ulcerans group]|nr:MULTISPECIES: DivIVA domain-containing protein [Mycobacterium ulcerans group]ACA50986.1 conserved membrane protein [Mycobacterium marinum DL240490]MBC9862727.1 hypothetical protein [Mycobacterium pseudoshottsii]UZK92617.1 DivIVA domain-containing protein [Mycobacterium ulcerans]